MQERETVSISGTVEHVTYRRADTGFTVMDIDSNGELVCVVGTLPQQINVGEHVQVEGYWDFHPSFGKQLRALSSKQMLPETSAGILKYLASGSIRGIGPVMASKIVETFGPHTFEIIEQDPQRLCSIKGITPKKADDIAQQFKKTYAIREAIVSLERFGMSPRESILAYNLFGPTAADTIRRNPYILCDEGIGIGFERAVQISEALPEPPQDKLRVQAGVVYVLQRNLNAGHTCVPLEKLIPLCTAYLEADETAVREALVELHAQKRIALENFGEQEFVFVYHIHEAELSAAKRLQVFLQFPPAGHATLESELDRLAKQNGVHYDERQREAIITAVQRGMLLLTGGPGTGKTTTINAILQMFEQQGLEVSMAAPTGRAAKRMSEITGKDAKTIHRLLEVEWDENNTYTFARDAHNPLEAQALILDELSMVDITLFAALLDALPLGCRLVMVGDADQLPPVGAGNVLHDLIGSGLLPVVELTHVFRQASQSKIVTNAHKIVKGEFPDISTRDNDFFFLHTKSAAATAKLVCDLVCERLPAAYGFSQLDDLQVISPSRKGEAGTGNLNRLLQARINPAVEGKNEFQSAGRIFREGDKVMQVKNNYDLAWKSGKKSGTGIFNGDIGIIESIDPRKSGFVIRFDERETLYPIEQLLELEPAYAITVHKSQGSEFEAVVLPLFGTPEPLAYRNLLYTAVTRAKQLLICVGDETLLAAMVANEKKARRYSALKHFLVQTIAGE